MSKTGYLVAAATFGAAVSALTALTPWQGVSADSAPAAAAATPVSVAEVQQRDVQNWNEFSGRMEAVERVEIRPRVAGQIVEIHFREGALVEKGASLVTIDPEPFEAEVARAKAEVAAAEARVTLAQSDLDRGRKMTALSTISQRDLDVRDSALRQANAAVQGAKAALRTTELNLGYTQVRAPIAGRVGKIEITVGNLVSAGPGAPVLVRLVSVDPIYASFDVDEHTVAKALASLPSGQDRSQTLGAIPVELASDGESRLRRGELQYVDPSVDAATGSVRVRGVFPNPDGKLMPGQFARLKIAEAKATPALLVSERAIGVDQDKKYVLVIDAQNKANYREVTLGASANGLRTVLSGLSAGERVVVNGLQKLRPGALVAPEPVAMNGDAAQKQASAAP
ncbi:efflux RND transporter periplasmic adaptor subunit [Hansschlegelia quercus]|uniref:Efflux RND transporter periplasmic adaptor subunit n=1 Tax=Hansschlegelia quercus TaxID=2528245 RepID=A0A4Q9GK54_9HYPH|nr:efflux RND transporter periplasmic adaptor subunit [Hansschlegelia quercus]TBN54739.1 efflux RND transporter periplasmic adaptor subunit [Hansschlegelia quercus]